MEWFNVFGLVFITVIMIPNIIFALKHKDAFENRNQNKAVEIIDGKAITNRALCKSCGACVSVCAVSAREICGKSMTVDEVFERVVEDKIFFQGSGGGVTASGGEALSHADFVRELFVKCHDAGIHTTLDTSGYADWKVLEKLVDCTDLFLFDIKHMDDQKHRELTAVSNVKILENAKKLVFLGKEVFIRLPIIPTMNDSDENMEATAEFVEKELGGKPRVALLAYHRLGDSKLDDLERADEFLGLQPPSEERMQYLKSLFEKHGLKVQIGG